VKANTSTKTVAEDPSSTRKGRCCSHLEHMSLTIVFIALAHGAHFLNLAGATIEAKRVAPNSKAAHSLAMKREGNP